MMGAATRSLTELVAERSAAATASGALVPIATEHELVEEAGIPFVVHILSGSEHKAITTRVQRRSGANPFLPPEPELLVTALSDTHLCVLNKFNVLDVHLLVVTRRFEHQRELLTLADFAALATAMGEIDGLGFYNAGRVAGASQPHKHLQLVPRLPGPLPTPVDAVVGAGAAWEDPHRCPRLRFPHAIARLGGAPLAARSAAELEQVYRRLLGLVAIADTTTPYNLLLTSRWMMVVPRRLEHYHGLSVNALGFAGSLLVPDRKRLRELRQVGPMAVLAEVAGAPAG